jgi:glucose/arabinose dehydrogenase
MGFMKADRKTRLRAFRRLASLWALAVPYVACSSSTPIKAGPGDSSVQMSDASADASADAPPEVAPEASPVTDADPGFFCARGTDVPGVQPPEGFCLKHFAQIGEARTLAFAPNGDLFVGAPSRATSGGATGGPGAVKVLSDDNHDGTAEEHDFLSDTIDVHGLALGGGYLYFTTQEAVWRTPYALGQRAETGPRESLNLSAAYALGGRWTHGLARSAGGRLLTSRGEYAVCGMSQGGEIGWVNTDGTLQTLAQGLRNPMYLRCHPTQEICAATELGEDLQPGAREKLLLLHPDTRFGYPCCYSTSEPISLAPAGTTCGDVTKEDASFPLSDTPFGLDWEPGLWPAPYQGALFVALHGSAYSNPPWQGARIVFANTDPVTRAPIEGWRDFLGGFGPDGLVLERPSDVAFAPDGRLFFADDAGGRVFWMAPTSLRAPN